jgi:hypothetical protein
LALASTLLLLAQHHAGHQVLPLLLLLPSQVSLLLPLLPSSTLLMLRLAMLCSTRVPSSAAAFDMRA